MFDWLDDVVDFGAGLFEDTSKVVGTAWDWGTKNPAVVSGVLGAGQAALSYMNRPESATKETTEYYEKRRREHNIGIAEAAKRYDKDK